MTGLSHEDRLRWISAHCAELEQDLQAAKAEACKLKLENTRLLREQDARISPGDEAIQAQRDAAVQLLKDWLANVKPEFCGGERRELVWRTQAMLMEVGR